MRIGAVQLKPMQRDPDANQNDLRMREHEGRLELADGGMKPGTGVSADLAGELHRLVRHPLVKNDPLRRALGKRHETIVDTTAGLGTDAVRMASLGAHVIAIERSPLIFALLEDGLRRAREEATWRERIGDRLEIRHGDARDLLAQIEPPPDVVYLDPMHPPKRRASALPRKEMQVLRRVVGEDEDAAALFDAAMRAARHRVVVKRPDHAPPIASNPAASHAGKLVRFDVYVATPLDRNGNGA